MKHLNYQTIGKQKGAALIVLVLALIMAASVLVIANYSIDKGKISYEKRTTEVLAKAKEALISYAVSFSENGATPLGEYGVLPCPERTTNSSGEGYQALNCDAKYEHTLGRLPWYSLGIEPLKDAAGECLWYVVSGGHKQNPRSDMLNEDTAGFLQLYDENGIQLTSNIPEERIVAAVIAPGSALSGQNRNAASFNLPCKVARNVVVASDYLESIGIHDNASFDTAQGIDSIIKANNQLQNTNINDRIIFITQDDIYDAIKKSKLFKKKIDVLTNGLAVCVDQYIVQNPAVAGGGCDVNICPSCNVNVCKSSCRNDREICWDQCDIDRDACRASGRPNKECNDERKICRDACSASENICNASCDIACVGGGGGGNNYWLPFPSIADLPVLTDYRLNASYNDNNVSIVGPGRLPFDIDNGVAGNGVANLLANCNPVSFIYTPAVGPPENISIDFSDTNVEYRVMWEHWKDHFFYAIGSAFEPTNAPNTGTPVDCTVTPTQCIEVLDAGGASTYHAAVIIYSGSPGVRVSPPLAPQLRRSDPPEVVAIGANESKGDLDNYLESYDVGNNLFQFTSGSDTDDRAFCVSESRVIFLCPGQ